MSNKIQNISYRKLKPSEVNDSLGNNVIILFIYIFISRAINYTNIFPSITLLVQIVSLLFILYFTTTNIKKIFYNRALLIVYLFIFSLGISLFFGGGDTHAYIAFLYPVLAYSFMLTYYSRNSILFRKFINVVSKYYLFLAFINLIITILIPNLFGDSYLLGGENLLGYTLLLGLLYNALSFYYNQSRVQLFFYILIHIANVLLIWSGGTLIGLTVVLSSLFFPITKKVFNKFSLSFWICSYSVFFVVVVLLNSTGILNDTIIESIVVNVLGKNMTFSGRIFVWFEVLLGINESPIIGHGLQSTADLFTIRNPLTSSVSTLSAHNQILQTVYEGGILALMIIILALFILSKKINSNIPPYISNLLKSVILALLFMYMTESPSLHYFWEIYVLSYSVITCVDLNKFKSI